MDFSIVIPAFNEKNRLLPFLKNLSLQIKESKLSGEIIIVDDGGLQASYQTYLAVAASS